MDYRYWLPVHDGLRNPNNFAPLMWEWDRRANEAIQRALMAYREPTLTYKGMRGMSRCTD